MHSILIDSEEVQIPSSFNGYIVKKKIGEGSFGSVFKVMKKETKEIFAAKFCHMKEGEQTLSETFIKNEAKILSIVDHPNIVKLYEAFEIENEQNQKLFVIIEEFCSRGSLFDFVNDGFLKNRRKNENKRMIRGFLEAVSYLHKMNVSHCDIKCENILVDENYNTKLCDFGFSINFDCPYAKKRRGSPLYLAPEFFFSKDFDFFKAEVWSVGVVIFAFSQGRLPYEDIMIHLERKLEIKKKNKKLKKIVKQCLTYDAHKRPTIEYLLNANYLKIT